MKPPDEMMEYGWQGVSTQPSAGYEQKRDWQLKFSWLPRRCGLTDKPLWLRFAYRGRRWITGPGDPVVDETWHEKHEHIIWQLKM